MASEFDASRFSVAFPLPYLLERGAYNVVRLPVVVLDDGTFERDFTVTTVLIDPGGAETVIDTNTVAAVDTMAIPWTPPASLAFGGGYVVEWRFVDDGNDTYFTFRNEAFVVRRQLICPISSANLYANVTSLNPANTKPIHSHANLDGFVTAAWDRIQRRLIEQGNRPNLIMSPSALHEVALYLSLALVFEDFSTRLNPAFMEQARMYREQYETAWGRLSFVYADGDGTTGTQSRRRSASSALFLGTTRGPRA